MDLSNLHCITQLYISLTKETRFWASEAVMVSRFEQDMTKMVAASVSVTEYNKDDEMPWRLVCPRNEKLLWVCGKDEQGRIVSVFQFQGNKDELADNRACYLPTEEKAKEIRQHLLDDGWVKTGLPKMRIKYPGMEPIEIGQVQLNRRQKRNYCKTMNALSNSKTERNRNKEAVDRLKRKLEDKKRD